MRLGYILSRLNKELRKNDIRNVSSELIVLHAGLIKLKNRKR